MFISGPFGSNTGGNDCRGQSKTFVCGVINLGVFAAWFYQEQEQCGKQQWRSEWQKLQRKNIGAIPASSSVKYPAKNETRTSCLNICLNPMAMTRIPKSVYYCLFSSAFALYQRHHVTSSDSFFSLETLRMFCLLAILKFYALRLAVVQTSYFLLVMNNHLFLRLNQFMQPCRHACMKFVARLLRLMIKNC